MRKLSNRAKILQRKKAQELAEALAAYQALIVDARIKVHLMQDKTQCRDTLSRFVFVLAVGTDIGICFDLNSPSTKSMHIALLSVAQMAVDGGYWDDDCKEFIAHAMDLAAKAFIANPVGGVEALTYAEYLSGKTRTCTLKISDLVSLEIYK